MRKSKTEVFNGDFDSKQFRWIYFNPDANSGDQYVVTEFTADEVIQSGILFEDDEFYQYLSSIGRQYCYDKGDDGYEEVATQFALGVKRACNKDTRSYLISLAEEYTSPNKVKALINGLAAGECPGIRAATAYKISDYAKKRGFI